MSDTSVISNLAIVGLLRVLKHQCISVTIPQAVERELLALDRADALTAIQSALREGWLQVSLLSVDEAEFASTLKLDPGESEAIALAKARGATLLCMDERRGRAKALDLGLPLVGIMGLLLREKKVGRLEAVKPHLIALIEQSNFFMSASLMSEVLELAGE
ncbi:MAG: DUF3368 domain-containing protein [Prosthecobacter sp.]|uniref:DUF3368 domain-containing protein n=1 Tax=Prosthecobacter sp. TaxID=1965333 RepID=UPI0038FDBBB2